MLNEYGNYDKYFQNFTKVSERQYESDDDGNLNWETKWNELKEKYNTPVDKGLLQNNQKDRETQLKEEMAKYGDDFGFVDYLKFKKTSMFEKLVENTNPRTTFEEVKEDIIKAKGGRRRGRKELPPIDFDIPFRIREKNKMKDKIKRENLREIAKEKPLYDPELMDKADKEHFNEFHRITGRYFIS